jgi:hypothetical protein
MPLVDELNGLAERILGLVSGLGQPIVLAQFATVAILFLIAHFAAIHLEPRFQDKFRALPDKRVSRLRIPLLLVRYLRPLIFVLLAWLVVYVMRQTTWPSRSYYIALAAGLVSAWIMVAIASRLIRNDFLRISVV